MDALGPTAQLTSRGEHSTASSGAGAPEAAPRVKTRNGGKVAVLGNAQFEGRGSIRGLVSVRPGTSFPATYTVQVGPSISLHGRAYAERRGLLVEGSRREFAVEDLPLGGYDVWIEAQGQNSRHTPVLLTQVSAHPYLTLNLSPTGFLDGFVVKDNGGPAEDLLVTLELTSGEARLETRTRPDGAYIFKDVPDGEYRILFGPSDGPLVPGRELAFEAPSLRFPKVELPPTVDIRVRTTDPGGKPVPDVTVSGFGSKAGRIELVTNAEGQAWARNLPPGRYRVQARDAEEHRARTTWEISAQSDNQEFFIAVR